jgi:hypothetical protein
MSLQEMTGAGIPWAPPEPGWRVKVRDNGLYRLTYAELVTAGLPVSLIDPRTIKMYNLGNELAIRVVGEGDGAFNSTDYIVFYGEGLDSKYTWDNIYWLTYGGDWGRRMGTRDGSPGEESVPDWHLSNRHIEENKIYVPSVRGDDDLERYFGANLTPPSKLSWTKTFTLDAPANAAGQMKISMYGLLSDPNINPDHHVRVTLNGEQIGEAYWDGKAWSHLSMPLRAGLLTAGVNTLEVTAVNDTGAFSENIYIDAVDLEYANTFTAVGDELWFKNGAAGVYRYQLNGFTTDQVEVYDVTDAADVKQVSNLAFSGSNPYMVEFSDVVAESAQYLAKAAGNYKVVQGIETMDTPSNLRAGTNGADHIIITPRAFWSQAEELRAHRAGQGLRAVKVDVQDVYDEFNYGIVSAYAIRDFLEYTYNAWVKPAPSYVVLMGDGHYDPKDYELKGKVSYIPPYLAFVDPTLGETAADNRYVTFKDGMGNRDSMPDMMLGRMAVNSAAEAQAMVDKVIAYEEDDDPPEPWRQQVLAIADSRDSGGLFDLLSDSLLAGHLAAPYTAEKVYLNVTHMTITDAKDAITAGINSGKLLVNYIGHASYKFWGKAKPYLFKADDVQNLANGGKLPIILAMTCYDGSYHFPYAEENNAVTAEVVTRAQGKGAVASWSSSGVGLASAHDFLDKGFFNAFFRSTTTTVGQATLAGKLNLWSTGVNSDDIETFLLFGDPALRVKRVPALKVSGSITAPSGGPLPGVQVSTTLANGLERTETSDADGNFHFIGLPRGEHVFTPFKKGYNFNPAASAPQVLDDSDLSGVNFTSSLAPIFVISGTVRDYQGQGLDGVTVSIDNGRAPMVTHGGGKYAFGELTLGTYQVSVSRADYFFPMPSRSVTISGENQTNINFDGLPLHSISGRITYNGAPLPGVTVDDGFEHTALSGVDGTYLFEGLTPEIYTLTPSLEGYAFVPGSQQVTLYAADVPGVNFNADKLGVNDPPLVLDIPDQQIVEGETFTAINLDDYVLDVDNLVEEIDWTFTGNSALNVSITDRVATISVKEAGWVGTETITFIATDPSNASDAGSASFTVKPSPPAVNIPDQTINEGEHFAVINLDDYVQDNHNADADMTWTYSGNVDMQVNITNRVATITLPHADWFGSEVITFRATAPGGLYGEDAVTFTVTPVNDAPVMVEDIPDQWVIQHGAAFTPIELDRFISDVDNRVDEINWSVEGDTNLEVTIIDRVATITQREADWSGSETITFRGTDPEGLFAEHPVNFDVVAVKPTVGQKLDAKRVTFEWLGITNANLYNVQLSQSDTFNKILLNATTSGLRFAYGSDLANGKTYYWRIRPRFGTTWGDWSTVKTSDQKPLEFLSMNPPLAPTLKAPAAGAFLRVKDVDFDWTDVVNADHYQLQISKTTAFKEPLVADIDNPEPGDQPFTVPDLPDGLYYWRIRAIDEVGVAGSWSVTRSFTVDTIAPAAPALVAPLAGAYTYDTTPTLAVKAVPGATWYRYRVVTKAEGEPATCEQNLVLTSDKLNKTSWSTMTPELPYGDTYYWCAQAVDAAENESPWSESEARQITITLQNLPKPGTETMVRTPTFSWFAVPGALGYELELEPVAEENNPASQVYSVPLGPVTAYTLPAIKALDPGLYQWRVTAHTRVGQQVGQQVSPWRQLMIMPGVPSLSSLGNGAYTMSNTPTLAWSAVEGAAAYRIMVDNHSNFSSPEYTAVVGTATHTLGTEVISMQPPDFNMLNDGRYYWKVQALDYQRKEEILKGGKDKPLNAWSAAWSFIVDTTQIAPELNLPKGGTIVPGTPTFSWKAAAGAKYYELWVDEADGDFSDPVYKTMLTTLNHKPPIIMEGSYRWKVVASDLAGNESTGNEERTVEVSPLKPAAPGLTGPANGAFLNDEKPEVVLSWNPVAYAKNYEVRVDANPRFTSPIPVYSGPSGNETSYLLPETAAHLLDNTRYYWQVRALNSVWTGPWSVVRSFTVDRTPPANPLLTLPANNASVAGTPTFSWKAAPGAKYYELWVDEEGGDFSDPVYKTMLTTLNHKPPIIMEGVYRWKVIASDLAGNESTGNEERTVEVSPLKPAAPVLAEPVNGAFLNDEKTEVVLSWNPVAYAQKYEVRVDNDPRFTSPEYSVPPEEEIKDTSYTLTETAAHLLDNTRYYWQVRALNSVWAGPWSAVRSFTVDRTAPAAPALVAPLVGAYTYDTTPTLAVKAVPGATWYRYRVVTKAEGEPATCEQNIVLTSDKLNKTSWSTMTQELPYGDTYYWCAQAIDAAGNASMWSEARVFTLTFQNQPGFAATTASITPGFSWYAVRGARGYRLEVEPVVEEGNTATREYSVYLGTVTSHVIPAIKALDPGAYQWRLRVYTAEGNEVTPWRLLVVLPPAPVLDTPVNGSVHPGVTVELKWSPAVGAERYQIQVDNYRDFKIAEKNQKFINVTETTENVTFPSAGVFYWRVRAINYLGNPGAWSAARYLRLTTP